jgi:hypothetical protein
MVKIIEVTTASERFEYQWGYTMRSEIDAMDLPVYFVYETDDLAFTNKPNIAMLEWLFALGSDKCVALPYVNRFWFKDQETAIQFKLMWF